MNVFVKQYINNEVLVEEGIRVKCIQHFEAVGNHCHSMTSHGTGHEVEEVAVDNSDLGLQCVHTHLVNAATLKKSTTYWQPE